MLRSTRLISLRVVVCSLFLCLLGGISQRAGATEPETVAAGKVADLKDTLEKGLRCRLPNEFAFVQRVVASVDAGELPEKDVLEIFTWARRKNEYRPFVYFQRGMQIKAEQLGVTL